MRIEDFRDFARMETCHKLLIVNGDDFGLSSSVNAAIIQAHREGILTSASLMVNGLAFHEAVTLARAYPRLGVGIHVTLARGRATLSQGELPNLVDRARNLPEDPVIAGLRYFFDQRLHGQIEKEIEAQIQRFLATGLIPSHIDGHLHLHVHPRILGILVRLAERYSIPAFRLPRESLRVNLRLRRRDLWRQLLHTFIYQSQCAYAERKLLAKGIVFPDRFFGLLQMGHMDETYLLHVIDNLEPGVTEIGMHPAHSLSPELERWAPHYEYQGELKALVAPEVKERIHANSIELANYRNLVEKRGIPVLPERAN